MAGLYPITLEPTKNGHFFGIHKCYYNRLLPSPGSLYCFLNRVSMGLCISTISKGVKTPQLGSRGVVARNGKKRHKVLQSYYESIPLKIKLFEAASILMLPQVTKSENSRFCQKWFFESHFWTKRSSDIIQAPSCSTRRGAWNIRFSPLKGRQIFNLISGPLDVKQVIPRINRCVVTRQTQWVVPTSLAPFNRELFGKILLVASGDPRWP